MPQSYANCQNPCSTVAALFHFSLVITPDRSLKLAGPQHLLWASNLLCSVWSHPSPTALVKYANDNTMVQLISDGDETVYRVEAENLSCWCSQNNLKLDVLKTKEHIMNFRRQRQVHSSPIINGEHISHSFFSSSPEPFGVLTNTISPHPTTISFCASHLFLFVIYSCCLKFYFIPQMVWNTDYFVGHVHWQ